MSLRIDRVSWVGAAAVALCLSSPSRAEEQLPDAIQPGTVVTAENAQSVARFFPEELRPYTIDGFDGLRMEIVR